MRIEETKIEGVLKLHSERIGDDRGALQRIYDADAAADSGLPKLWTQVTQTWTPAARTLRGMHFQAPPHAETKLVTCLNGAVYDVVIDLRGIDEEYCEWQAFNLDASTPYSLLIPPGCAHGYLSLTDNVSLLYHITPSYAPESARRVHWDDPDIGVRWPEQPILMSDADRSAPRWRALDVHAIANARVAH